MHRTCFIAVLLVECVATLWFKDLEQPKKLFCRLCPLYCRPKADVKQADKPEAKSDKSPIVYIDEHGPFLFADYFDHVDKWSFHRWATPAPSSSTTTAAPTTEGPSGICILCTLKSFSCGFIGFDLEQIPYAISVGMKRRVLVRGGVEFALHGGANGEEAPCRRGAELPSEQGWGLALARA
ncbi:hypothetical protein EVAR_25736_1 [Eumeta japonica]|uniref:Secreted protein n=1 Tax=Eumeta variegata TaxID=151549 RepID=A0A4C1V8S0_EUMVA|nr:hypothetical protein EVAR_25736_1 [Eumeta japonica]